MLKKKNFCLFILCVSETFNNNKLYIFTLHSTALFLHYFRFEMTTINTSVFQLNSPREFTEMTNEFQIGSLLSDLISGDLSTPIPEGTIDEMKFFFSDENIQGDGLTSLVLLIQDMTLSLQEYNSNLVFIEPFFLRKLFGINSTSMCVTNFLACDDIPSATLVESLIDSLLSLGWILHARLDRAVFLGMLIASQFGVENVDEIAPFLKVPIFQEFCLTGSIRINPSSKSKYDLNEVFLRGGKYFRNGRPAEYAKHETIGAMTDIIHRFLIVYDHLVQVFTQYERVKAPHAESFYVPRGSMLIRNFLLTSKIARFYPDIPFNFSRMSNEKIIETISREKYNPRYTVRYVIPKIEFLMNLVYISRVAHDLDNSPEHEGKWLKKQPSNPCVNEVFLFHLLLHRGGKPLF